MKFVAGENCRNPEKTYPQSVSFTTKHTWCDRDRNQGCSSAEGSSSTANSETKAAVLPGIEYCSCDNFPSLSANHSLSLSLFGNWTDLRISQTWRWGEWIWLTGLSGHHRNSPHGLNISFFRVFDQIRDPEIPITLRPYNIKRLKKIMKYTKV